MKKLLLILGSIFTMLNILIFAFMIHSSITNILPYEIMEEQKASVIIENERLQSRVEFLESEDYVKMQEKYETFYNNVLMSSFNLARHMGYRWDELQMTYVYEKYGYENVDVLRVLNTVQHENYKLMGKE